MTPALHARAVSVLSALVSGSALLDSLIPDAAALLDELQNAPSRPCAPRRATKSAAAVLAPCQSVDTSQLSHAALFAHYRRTSLRDDCRFWLAHAPDLADSLRNELTALLAELETRKATTADRRQYYRLQDAWRQDANRLERERRHQRTLDVAQARLARRLARAHMRMSKTRQAA